MKTSVYLALFTIIAAFLVISGCISALKPAGPGSGDTGLSPLEVHFIGQEGDWSFSRGLHLGSYLPGL
jgi:hypothetical protein